LEAHVSSRDPVKIAIEYSFSADAEFYSVQVPIFKATIQVALACAAKREGMIWKNASQRSLNL